MDDGLSQIIIILFKQGFTSPHFISKIPELVLIWWNQSLHEKSCHFLSIADISLWNKTPQMPLFIQHRDLNRESCNPPSSA